ncbi:MAG: AAA family ATPase [Pseudomonadota bacterium]
MDTEPGSRRSSRRYLTALFSDLSHSTALASASDPEGFAALLDQLNALFERVIARHGGTILQIRGDGVFAAFGLTPQEDAARRAAMAAVELHGAVRALSYPDLPAGQPHLTLHSGIHSSYVVAIEGDQVSGRLTLVGEAGNIAAKLSDAASADEILITEASLGSYQPWFEVAGAKNLTLTDMDTPYPVLRIVAVAGNPEPRQYRDRTPLLGRGAALVTLQASLAASDGGAARIVAMTGPAGIGKTRLAEDFLAPLRAEAHLVLRGYCEAGQNAEPLQPILQILRAALIGPADVSLKDRLSALDEALATHGETFAALLAPAREQRSTGEAALFGAVVALFDVLSRNRTLVLLIDDWHWADDLTVATINHARTHCRGRLLLLQCSREPMASIHASEVLELAPLNRTHGARMVESLAGQADAEQVDAVLDASGGNPLFIEELCHALERPLAAPNRAHWQSAPVPNRLAALIASRINRLGPAQRDLLQTLAVMGNVIPRWLFDAGTAGLDVAPLLADLAAADLVYALPDDPSLRFKHGVTHDVVLDSIDGERRALLHGEMAAIIEALHPEPDRGGVSERLAYHYGHTDAHGLAADYAEAAGDRALAAGATDRVRVQYQAALAALDRLQGEDVYERWVAIAKRLALACLFDAEPQQCEIYRQMIRRAVLRSDTANELDGEYWLAYLNYALGNAPEAIKHVDRAQFLAGHIGGAAMQTQVLSTWGQSRALACDYEAALPAIDQALAQQAPYKQKPGVAFAYAYTLAGKSMVLGDQGDFPGALACLEEAELLTRGPVHPVHGSIVSMKTAVLIWQGSWAQAEAAALSNIEIGTRTGSRYITAAGRALLGYARWQQDASAPVDDVARALAWIERHHQAIWTSLHFSWLCEMLVSQERYEEARRAAVWVLQRARKRERLGESVAYCALGTIPSPASPHAAARCFDRAQRSAELRQSRREQTLVTMKRALHEASRAAPDTTLRKLAECEQRFSELGMYSYASRAQQAQRGLKRPAAS